MHHHHDTIKISLWSKEAAGNKLCHNRHSKTVVETLDDKKIEHEGSKSSKEEAGSKDETDGGEVEGENPGGCESKEAANDNVAKHRLQSNELCLTKCIEDTGEQVAKHESNVEGEKEEHEAYIVLWLGNLKN